MNLQNLKLGGVYKQKETGTLLVLKGLYISFLVEGKVVKHKVEVHFQVDVQPPSFSIDAPRDVVLSFGTPEEKERVRSFTSSLLAFPDSLRSASPAILETPASPEGPQGTPPLSD